MKKIHAQKINGAWHPYTLDDADISAEFKENQICGLVIYGSKKERSLPQLNTYWACCALVAENSDNRYFATRQLVSAQVKVKLQFIDLNKSFVDPSGTFHPHYRSISVKNLSHMEACNFFDRAFEWLAELLNCTVDEMIAIAKSKMRTR